MRKFFIALNLFVALFGAVIAAGETDYSREARDLLILRDAKSAADVAQKGLACETDSQELWELYIRALGQQGNESAALGAWSRFRERYPKEQHKAALEEVCWTVLESGMRSSSALMRLYALIGAAMNADRRSVAIILQGLDDGSTIVRYIAAEMAGLYRDKVIIDALIHLLEREHHPQVRLAIIQTLGKQRVVKARPLLMQILQKKEGSSQEIAALVATLDQLMDRVAQEELEQLVMSEKAGLRVLACHLVANRELEDLLDVLQPLENDHHPAVVSALYEVCGLMRPQKLGKRPVSEILLAGLKSSDPQASATAAWALAVLGDETGKDFLKDRLGRGVPRTQRIMAAATAALGPHGTDLMWEGLNSAHDPYVKLSLALGLLSSSEKIESSCEAIHQVMKENRDLWHWQNLGMVLTGIESTQGSLGFGMVPLAEAMDQMVRLELLSLLAIKGYAHALDGVRDFLRETHWGVGAIAAVVLLSEGDEEALDVVRYCLQESDQSVRTQAALVLALWGKDQEAVRVLEEIYPTSERAIKERILEGIGHAGDEESLPFLCDALSEPFQGLRLVAAASILQALFL